MNKFRLRWAEPWTDRPAKSVLNLEHMENGMILRQFQLTRADAAWVRDQIDKFLQEPMS